MAILKRSFLARHAKPITGFLILFFLFPVVCLLGIAASQRAITLSMSEDARQELALYAPEQGARVFEATRIDIGGLGMRLELVEGLIVTKFQGRVVTLHYFQPFFSWNFGFFKREREPGVKDELRKKFPAHIHDI